MGDVGVERGRCRRRRPSSRSARTPGSSPTTGATSSPARARSACVAVKGRMPLGYYKDEAKSAATFQVIDGARYSIPGDYRDRRGRRHAAAARPRLGVHQHRRREGLPRGGRGGPQDAPRPCAMPSPSACPTSASARPSCAMVEPGPDGALDEADVIAHVKSKLSSFKAPQARAHRRHDRTRPQRQGRLQAPQGRGRGARLTGGRLRPDQC